MISVGVRGVGGDRPRWASGANLIPLGVRRINPEAGLLGDSVGGWKKFGSEPAVGQRNWPHRSEEEEWLPVRSKKGRRMESAFHKRKNRELGDWRCCRCAFRNFRRRVRCWKCHKVWSSSDFNFPRHQEQSADPVARRGLVPKPTAPQAENVRMEPLLPATSEGVAFNLEVVPLKSISNADLGLWGKMKEGWDGDLDALEDWLSRNSSQETEAVVYKIAPLEIQISIPAGANRSHLIRDWCSPSHSPLEDLQKWDTKFPKAGKPSWWKIEGVPPEAWCADNFQRIGRKIGRVVEVDLSCYAGFGYEVGRMLIMSEGRPGSELSLQSSIDGTIRWILASRERVDDDPNSAKISSPSPAGQMVSEEELGLPLNTPTEGVSEAEVVHHPITAIHDVFNAINEASALLSVPEINAGVVGLVESEIPSHSAYCAQKAAPVSSISPGKNVEFQKGGLPHAYRWSSIAGPIQDSSATATPYSKVNSFEDIISALSPPHHSDSPRVDVTYVPDSGPMEFSEREVALEDLWASPLVSPGNQEESLLHDSSTMGATRMYSETEEELGDNREWGYSLQRHKSRCILISRDDRSFIQCRVGQRKVIIDYSGLGGMKHLFSGEVREWSFRSLVRVSLGSFSHLCPLRWCSKADFQLLPCDSELSYVPPRNDSGLVSSQQVLELMVDHTMHISSHLGLIFSGPVEEYRSSIKAAELREVAGVSSPVSISEVNLKRTERELVRLQSDINYDSGSHSKGLTSQKKEESLVSGRGGIHRNTVVNEDFILEYKRLGLSGEKNSNQSIS
ncbi:uncharacterized protein LOC143857192 [Tasmannia lanceolata]|uniref:uncharacterized protein LOC143857192 n=1 Tax=Tasmannia lanceolata TaxID=3420 RepID=UPI00406373E5